MHFSAGAEIDVLPCILFRELITEQASPFLHVISAQQ